MHQQKQFIVYVDAYLDMEIVRHPNGKISRYELLSKIDKHRSNFELQVQSFHCPKLKHCYGLIHRSNRLNSAYITIIIYKSQTSMNIRKPTKQSNTNTVTKQYLAVRYLNVPT